MKKVTFTKDWRGHKSGDTVELTDKRAAELERQGYFKSTNAKPKKEAASKDK